MAWLALAFTVLSEVDKGASERDAAVGKANQMRARASSVRGSSQRAAIEERRRAELVASRARAVAGASGGSVSDAGMINILGDIGAEGEYRALSKLWEGDEVGLGLEYGADLAVRAGKAAAASSALSAASTAFSGVTSMRDRAGTNTALTEIDLDKLPERR